MNLFGTHIGRRAQDTAAGQSRGRFSELGNTKVTQEGISLPVKHNIARLQISVNDPLAVGIIQRRTEPSQGLFDFADGQRLAAIVNCGFPESSQNETALRICQQFAREAGFEWAGGLALGAGQSINGRPLADLGGMVRNIAAALDLAAGALAEGGSVLGEAVTAMASPMMPAWTYSLFGGIGWRLQARQHGAQRKLNARPYERG